MIGRSEPAADDGAYRPPTEAEMNAELDRAEAESSQPRRGD
jgi:hypothetical protein